MAHRTHRKPFLAKCKPQSSRAFPLAEPKKGIEQLLLWLWKAKGKRQKAKSNSNSSISRGSNNSNNDNNIVFILRPLISMGRSLVKGKDRSIAAITNTTYNLQQTTTATTCNFKLSTLQHLPHSRTTWTSNPMPSSARSTACEYVYDSSDSCDSNWGFDWALQRGLPAA